MNQSRSASLIETTTNFVAGVVLSILSYWFLLPMFGIHIPLIANLSLTGYFAAMSFVKTYAIRRGFNAHLRRKMYGVRAPMGSTKVIRGTAGLPGMQRSDYHDVIGGYESKPQSDSDGWGPQKHVPTGGKEDKELR